MEYLDPPSLEQGRHETVCFRVDAMLWLGVSPSRVATMVRQHPDLSATERHRILRYVAGVEAGEIPPRPVGRLRHD